jgi:hypothetical protein
MLLSRLGSVSDLPTSSPSVAGLQVSTTTTPDSDNKSDISEVPSSSVQTELPTLS